MTAFCCHRGRAWPNSWCTTDALHSPATSIPVGKCYSARGPYFPLDAPEQCCGVSLSTLTHEDRQMATTSGPPTTCRLDYCELAHNDCLIGATNGLPGDFFGVTRRTIPEPDRHSPRLRKTTGGKGAKGGNLQQHSGASDSPTISIMSTGAATAGLRRSAWRKPAETGGNSLQKLSARNCPHFPCLTFGVRYTESTGCRLAGNSRCRPAVTSVSATNVFSPNLFKDLATPARSSSGWRQVSSHCHIFVIGQ